MYSGSGKFQGPEPLSANAFGLAQSPAVLEVQEVSNQVILNGALSASYHFCVTTASVGITLAGDVPLTNTSCKNGSVSYIGHHGVGADASPITVPLNANVWSGSGAAPVAGAVIFVYNGGL